MDLSTQFFLLQEASLMILFIFSDDFTIMSDYFAITAERTLIVIDFDGCFSASEFLREKVILSLQVLQLFLEFPLPQAKILLLFGKFKLILFDK